MGIAGGGGDPARLKGEGEARGWIWREAIFESCIGSLRGKPFVSGRGREGSDSGLFPILGY